MSGFLLYLILLLKSSFFFFICFCSASLINGMTLCARIGFYLIHTHSHYARKNAEKNKKVCVHIKINRSQKINYCRNTASQPVSPAIQTRFNFNFCCFIFCFVYVFCSCLSLSRSFSLPYSFAPHCTVLHYTHCSF